MSDISEQLVDAINLAYGVHPGHRAAHAKGVLCAATFAATPEAASVTRAPHFGGQSLRAHVRFSNGSGDPTAPDGTRDGRGLALKVYRAEGGTTDVSGLSLPCFFVRTPEDLLAFNEARRVDPATGAPDLTKIGAFLEQHPETLPAVGAAMTAPIPASYAQLTYNSIHAYRFLTSDGSVRAGRYQFVPEAGEAAISDEEAAARDADYLRTELEDRFAAGPAVFHLDVVLAEPGDPIDDPTAAWPEDRARVRMARIELTGLAYDREQEGDILVFDPTRITDGIELSDDPILRARPGAYSVSIARRTS